MSASTDDLARVLAKHQLADVLPYGVSCTCGADLASLNPPLDDGAVNGEALALAVHQLQEMECRAEQEGTAMSAGPAAYTCIYRKCSDQTIRLEPAAADLWMDEHAREVAHPHQWPITFRIDYPGNDLVATAYRDPIKLAR